MVTAPTLDAGGGIVLHPRSTRDADEVWSLVERHRDTLREWLPWIDATHSVADVRRYASFMQTQFEQFTGFDYALRLEGTLIGGIGLHEIDWSNRSGAIGYWLAPDVHGRGIMTRTVAALIDHAIPRYGLHRFEIRAVIENTKSRAIPERLGFAHEGTLTEAYYLHHRFRDLAIYSITATRWHRRNATPLPSS